MLLVGALALAGCAPNPAPITPAPPSTTGGARLSPRQAAANFLGVVTRVEPVAEAVCRARTKANRCDFRIVIDNRRNLPPNAFQTVDDTGRPVIGFTIALIAEARNPDEVAFVLGHEASHHILGHIPLQRRTAYAGAVIAGILASASGQDAAGVRSAQAAGAQFGARSYAKEFELQADALGAEIAWRAGYDPVRGAGFFDRLPDPGDQFLGTHPANADRKAQVARIVARLQTTGM